MEQTRSDVVMLVNAPVKVQIGGGTTSESVKTIELRTPALKRAGEQWQLCESALLGFFRDNMKLLVKMWNEPDTLTDKDVLVPAGLIEAADTLLCDLVGEDSDYVLNELTLPQTTFIIQTYLDLIGWDLIQSTLIRVWQAKTGKDETETQTTEPQVADATLPPWSVGRSSPSQDSTASDPNGSGPN